MFLIFVCVRLQPRVLTLLPNATLFRSVWYLTAGYAADAPAVGAAVNLFGQLLLAGIVGTLGLVPVALTQNAAMDRLGVPPASEQP